MRRIVYLTAVPGQKTGTANYFDIFLAQCVLEGFAIEQLIVCDLAQGPLSDLELHGNKIIDYKSYAWKPDDIVVCFIANNEFHAFVLDFLVRCPKDAIIISVIHDPQIFMLSAAICAKGWFGLCHDDFVRFVRHEVVPNADRMVDLLKAQTIPEILKYTLCCQSVTLEKSNYIIVHSHYARLKLYLEHVDSVAMPPILVSSHPVREESAIRTQSEKFVVGCFGWIARSKRPRQVMTAFAEFVNTLPLDEQSCVELKFVGQLAEKSLSPIKIATSLKMTPLVRHLGYVPADVFRQEVASTNLILNLRYPSCGETSGTLFHAIEAGGRVILSDYQSFSEEPAVYHVSIDPDEEKNQIVDALKKEFRLWKIGANQKQDDMKALAKKSASLVCLDVISSLIKRSNNGDSHEIANR